MAKKSDLNPVSNDTNPSRKPVPEKAVEKNPPSIPVPVVEVASTEAPVLPAAPVLPQAFSREDLARLEIVQLKARNAQQTTKIAELEAAKYLAEVQEKARLMQQEIEKTRVTARSLEQEMMDFYVDLNNRYKVDMKAIKYNPVTGQIFR